MKKNKILVIIGPTSSGKSDLAVKLAKKYNGEIISADSRQVYKNMNIGTGKITKKEMRGIPHWGLDLVSPKKQFSVAEFKDYAQKKIEEITSHGRLPILCGGTGHWIDAVVFNQALPEVEPNKILRKQLAKLSTDKLFSKLKKLDPVRATNIDKQNPRRLIRALEIIEATGKPIPKSTKSSPYTVEWIGINPRPEVLIKNIELRLDKRLKAGMLTEVQKLKASGVPWKKLEEFGLEYKYCALLLQKKIKKEEFKPLLLTAIKQYSKRQLTWWRKNKKIKWLDNPQNTH